MKILVVGSGGREHALAWKIAQSEIVDEVFCVPGNPGMDEIGPCFDVDPTDLHNMQELVLQLSPDLIVIGPEAPLAAGLSDALRARGFDVFGPSEKAAQLESYSGVLAYSEDPLVSSDVIGDPHSSIFDSLSTSTAPGGYARVLSWYDNEWGYSNRVVDLIDRLGRL